MLAVARIWQEIDRFSLCICMYAIYVEYGPVKIADGTNLNFK